MYQYLAYIPYAAVGYCVAKVAADVWPSLRSQLGSFSHYSSRAGLAGEATHSRVSPELCSSGGGPLRNQATVCFDESTNTILGGNLDGTQLADYQVAIYVNQAGVRMANIPMMGPNESALDIPVCVTAGPSIVARTPSGGGEQPPSQIPGEPPPSDSGLPQFPPQQYGPCDPRTMTGRTPPVFRQADCGPGGLLKRNADPDRLARKRRRWG